MNAPAAPSLLATVDLAPRDPILGVTEAFNADPNPRKVNLGVGVYCDDAGKVPLLDCVREAERALTDKAAPRSYLPIDGIPAYDREARALLFGADAEVIRAGRAVTVQALGGTGALKVGADFLRRFAPGAQVWISDPSWENHRALFEGAGFTVNTYPYYDAATHGLDFAGMRAKLETLPAGVHRAAARLLPQPHRRRSDAGAMGRDHHRRPRARARSLRRPRLPGLRRRPRSRRRRGAPARRDAGPAARLHVVLEVVLAVRRARRRAVRRRRGQGRGRPACSRS